MKARIKNNEMTAFLGNADNMITIENRTRMSELHPMEQEFLNVFFDLLEKEPDFLNNIDIANYMSTELCPRIVGNDKNTTFAMKYEEYIFDRKNKIVVTKMAVLHNREDGIALLGTLFIKSKVNKFAGCNIKYSDTKFIGYVKECSQNTTSFFARLRVLMDMENEYQNNLLGLVVRCRDANTGKVLSETKYMDYSACKDMQFGNPYVGVFKPVSTISA